MTRPRRPVKSTPRRGLRGLPPSDTIAGVTPRLLLLFAFASRLATAAPPSSEAADASKVVATSDGDEAPPKLPLTPKVKECCGYPIAAREGFRLSFYWLAYESDYAFLPYDVEIYDRRGFFLGSYPRPFVYELILEGTGVLRDGRVLNYDGRCAYGVGICFDTLDPGEKPLGRGVQDRALVPFRSIAVDPRFIPIGSPVFVPELAGVVLPDGTRHDGCLRADDMGGAIKLRKLDFFVESYPNFKYLADQLWWRMRATPHLDEPRCEYLRRGERAEWKNERTDWATLHKHHVLTLARAAKIKRGRPTSRSRTTLTATLGARPPRQQRRTR